MVKLSGGMSDQPVANDTSGGLVRPDYAPPEPVRWQRFWPYPVTLIAIIVLVAWVIPWGNRMVARWQGLKHQERCMAYRAPADQIVYDNDPAEAQRLVALGGGYDWAAAPNALPAASPAVHVPEFWRRHPQPLGQAGHALVFLHERTSPGGNRRLVFIELVHEGYAGGSAMIHFSSGIMERETMRRKRTKVTGQRSAFHGYVSAPERFRVFAGQPDAADKSHFTFDYEIEYMGNRQRGTFDGWLMDDDRVVLKPKVGERGEPYVWQPALMHGVRPAGPATGPASRPAAE
jgi:hypothetical protein